MADNYSVKIIPGTLNERKFMDILEASGVKNKLVKCRRGVDFNTAYDEYLISHGLYKIISKELQEVK